MTRPWDAARIAEVRARCEAATDGPWRFGRGQGTCHLLDGRGYMFAEVDDDGNGRFAAAARTDLPEALDEIVRLAVDNARHAANFEQCVDRIVKLRRHVNDLACDLAAAVVRATAEEVRAVAAERLVDQVRRVVDAARRVVVDAEDRGKSMANIDGLASAYRQYCADTGGDS